MAVEHLTKKPLTTKTNFNNNVYMLIKHGENTSPL